MGRGGRRLWDVAVLPGGPGGLGDVVRADVPSAVWPPKKPAWSQGFGRPRKPRLETVSAGPWSSAATSCRRRPGVRLPIRGKPGATQLPFHAPGCDRPARRKNPLGRLPPEPRQRTPLLPVNAPEDTPWRPWHTWEAPVGVRLRRRKANRPGRVRDPHLGWLASPRGPVPAGRAFLLSLQQAWGESLPHQSLPQVYRVVREMLPRERFGPTVSELLRWLEDTQDSNERAKRSHAKRRAAMRASPHIPP